MQSLPVYSSIVRNTLLLTALFALITICSGCHTKNGTTQQPSLPDETKSKLSTPTYDDPDAYSVYNLLLGQSDDMMMPVPIGGRPRKAIPKEPLGPIAIESMTGGDKLCFDAETRTDSRLRQAGIDYKQENSKPRLLKPDELRFGRKIELISPSDLDSIFAAGIIPGWKKFNDIHTDVQGYTQLSAVGFSADKNFAVVFSGRYCGPRCGAGGIVTFSRKNGIWRRNSDQLCSWIS